MPELPEVQTTVNGINRTAKGRTIIDVHTSYNSSYHAGKDNIKDPKFFKLFKSRVKGKKILGSERRAKNVLIHLEQGYTILVHLKMTGHLLFGTYRKEVPRDKKQETKWIPVEPEPLKDPFNSYIRLVFSLDNGKHLVLSDMRKFAKVTLIKTAEVEKCLHLEHLGPEPLDSSFRFPVFKSQLMRRPTGKIKTVLMDQTLVAGIGNIYSDEILWRAGVHPLSGVGSIPDKNFKAMFKAMKEVLTKGIELGGDSMSDYRNIEGKKGEFQEHHRAYQRKGEQCDKRGCSGVLEKTSIGGRSAHFCPVHQELFKSE